jgi:ABC-type uncharacterized transport system permease subunit
MAGFKCFSVIFCILFSSTLFWKGCSLDNKTFTRKNILNIKQNIISAAIGCAMMQASPASATLSSLAGIAGASEAVEYISNVLDNMDEKKQNKEDVR